MISTLFSLVLVAMPPSWVPLNIVPQMTGEAPAGTQIVAQDHNFDVIVKSTDKDTWIDENSGDEDTEVFDSIWHVVQVIDLQSGTTNAFVPSGYANGTITYTHNIHSIEVEPGSDPVIAVDHYRAVDNVSYSAIDDTSVNFYHVVQINPIGT